MKEMANQKHDLQLKTRSIDCPLCGSGNHKALCQNDRYKMGLITVGCLTCGMIFINPRPTEEFLNQFYTSDYRRFYQSVEYPTPQFIQSGTLIPRAESTVKIISNLIDEEQQGDWLDIGCGEGTLLRYAAKKFKRFKFYGVEPGVQFSDYARQTTGAQAIYTESWDTFISHNAKMYDLITMSHVLEHAIDPVKMLSTASNMLTMEGYFYIEVPNVMNQNCKGIGNIHIGHLHSFYPQTIRYAFECSGLKIIRDYLDGLPSKTPSMAYICKRGMINTNQIPGESHITDLLNDYQDRICPRRFRLPSEE
jgi:2-polyprenyl-3-methyl-5-hydroxy-6-metoxy-1,4-benzoquinol methylase